MIDSITQRWIRNASDERAAAAGYRFDEGRGQFVVDWMQDYLTLYEGEQAGEPFVCRDWQYEVTMRVFGWVKFSEHWHREIRRFREVYIKVAKKNKKSPTLAAWGLYLFAGDGEPGQKVFLAAKDGTQARGIAGKHAIEMAMSSPKLMQECSINMSLLQITHEPSRSIILPLSSGSIRSKEAKQGLNGCVLIDEVHVVDRDFVTQINRAGISRSEPLMIEVTTAGNNPDSYGYEREEYARSVLDGKAENHHLFVALYEAPQTLSNADLASDPVKYGKMANPAWGHTVVEEEFLNDYATSKATPAKLADFKMYRLDIWQHTANPWLRKEDWDNGLCQYGEDDLAGQACAGGWDLGSTDDMTALALVFPSDLAAWFSPAVVQADEGKNDDEESGIVRRSDIPAKVLLWYWMPEGAVEKLADKVPQVIEWVRDGWIVKTPGNAIDYAAVEDDVATIVKRFDLCMLAYDERFAGASVQRVQAARKMSDDRLLKFRQSMASYTGPTAHFERLVLAGKLHHNGNPVTDWQISHVHIATGMNECRQPVKPGSAGDYRKIDGVVAMVMGLDGAVRMPKPRKSVYARRGAYIL